MGQLFKSRYELVRVAYEPGLLGAGGGGEQLG